MSVNLANRHNMFRTLSECFDIKPILQIARCIILLVLKSLPTPINIRKRSNRKLLKMVGLPVEKRLKPQTYM